MAITIHDTLIPATGGGYPIAISTDIKGSFISVATTGDLHTIPTGCRTIGQLAYVYGVTGNYRLVGGIANSNWMPEVWPYTSGFLGMAKPATGNVVLALDNLIGPTGINPAPSGGIIVSNGISWVTGSNPSGIIDSFATITSGTAVSKEFIVGTGSTLSPFNGGSISANKFNNNSVIASLDGGTNATGYDGTNIIQWNGTKFVTFPMPASGSYVVVSQSGIGVTGIFVGSSGQGLITNGITWMPGYIPVDITSAVVKNPTGHPRNYVASTQVQTLLALLLPSGNPAPILAGGEGRTFFIGTSGIHPHDFAVDYQGNIYQGGSKHYHGSGIVTLSGVASGINFVYPGALNTSYISVATGMSSVTGEVLCATTGNGVGHWRKLGINELADVHVESASSGQALVFNGTGWLGGTVASSGGGSGGDKYTTTLASGSSVYTVNHNLNSRGLISSIYKTLSPFTEVHAQINHSGVNDFQVLFSSNTTVDYDIVVVGTATSKYMSTLTAGSASYTVTHNMNSRAVIARIYQSAGIYQEVEPEIIHTTVNAVTINFSSATAVDYDIVIIG